MAGTSCGGTWSVFRGKEYLHEAPAPHLEKAYLG